MDRRTVAALAEAAGKVSSLHFIVPDREPNGNGGVVQIGRLAGLLGGPCAVIVLIAYGLTTTRADAQPAEAPPSLSATAPVTPAQTAERPLWNVGYKWKFHQVSGLPAVESRWSREVTKSLPEGQFLVRQGSGKELVFDGEANSLDPRGPDYSAKYFSFPLFVGKEWTHKRRFGDDGYETSSWKVKAYEKATVPAGTYDCFRVEGVVWGSLGIAPYPRLTSHQDVTYWYCPTIKWFARLKSHRRGDQYSPYIDSESELTSFSAGQ
jgi:hypothetical protein